MRPYEGCFASPWNISWCWLFSLAAADRRLIPLLPAHRLGPVARDGREGGFVVDYVMPAGSSLEETNRVISHVERILAQTPEVEGTSRRTGLQLGLAQVTEANTGDISVKLKDDKKRSTEEVINDVRARVKKAEPVVDPDFIQTLQDQIGDLTSAPQPAVIKLFNQDPELLDKWAISVGDNLKKVPGVVDIVGLEDTIKGLRRCSLWTR